MQASRTSSDSDRTHGCVRLRVFTGSPPVPRVDVETFVTFRAVRAGTPAPSGKGETGAAWR